MSKRARKYGQYGTEGSVILQWFNPEFELWDNTATRTSMRDMMDMLKEKSKTLEHGRYRLIRVVQEFHL